ncbi:MAG: hypothetical protein RMK73_04735 [Geminicoccaceae bacterium]|nr:hypothetical protein [Geminicoccaceae bacterium]MCS7268537.1 hypothetical protein [Geminicoccaceae bacterium]MDW8125587.1 hypothetical protein [Geminicoccaceae bacterium]MDW8340773.1 hypothetical protein [Geminicoccaceae bacterium]
MDHPEFLEGLLVRTRDDSLFFVPLSDLLSRYRLPEDQQRGAPAGDSVLEILDRSAPLRGLKNAILGDRIVVAEPDPEVPSGGKQRFAAELFEAVEPEVPVGGKQRFATPPSD